MLQFFSETRFKLQEQEIRQDWLFACADKFNREVSDLNYIFCSDNYLLKINQQHLNHNYYTDIISFDYSDEHSVSGDIFISVDRVADNAFEYNEFFDVELARVMAHGLLHLVGFKDKTEEEANEMRLMENECLALLYAFD